MTYITKKQRTTQQKSADSKFQVLLVTFGNFMLERKGINDKVTDEDMKEFIVLLNKK